MWDNPKRQGRKGGRVGGKASTPRKRAASRANGAKGGRPKAGYPNVVQFTEKLLRHTKVFPFNFELYPYTIPTLRATLIRKGRRDLWLRLKHLPQSITKTYEDYLDRMSALGVSPISREQWEENQRQDSKTGTPDLGWPFSNQEET